MSESSGPVPLKPAAAQPPYARWAAAMRSATLVAFGLLLSALTVNRILMPQATWQADLLIWSVQCLPLLILLPGLWRGKWTTYAWLCFVVLIYFAAAVTQLFLPQWRVLDTILLILSIALFSFALLFIRWRARANRAAQP